MSLVIFLTRLESIGRAFASGKGEQIGPGAVRVCACPKLTTTFHLRTPSGKILDGVLGPALLQPTVSSSLPSLHDFFSPCVCVCVAMPPSCPRPFLPAAVLLGSEFDFLTRSGHVVVIVMWLAGCLIPHGPIRPQRNMAEGTRYCRSLWSDRGVVSCQNLATYPYSGCYYLPTR